MTSVLELVALALYDHGPLTMSELSVITCLPLASIRTHLHLNHEVCYSARLSWEDGVPIRRWFLYDASITH